MFRSTGKISMGGININVSITKDNGPNMIKALQMLAKHNILVGVPEEKAGRKAQGPINNAALAYIHNTGAPEANIPARPFMEPGIQEGKAKILDRMEQVGQAALAGKVELVMKGLHAIGLVAQSAIRNKINTGPFQPLAKATLSARERRGRKGDKPLIDTGQLRNSINYVVL